MKDYPGPVDDMIVFALSALLNGNQLFVDNSHYYGVSIKDKYKDKVTDKDKDNTCCYRASIKFTRSQPC